MSWKEICTMQQRQKLVRAELSGHACVAELCRRASVSRKSAYKWIGRFEQRGLAGLRDQSRARHEQAGRVSDAVTDEILAARHAHPNRCARERHVPPLPKTGPMNSWPSSTAAGSTPPQIGNPVIS